MAFAIRVLNAFPQKVGKHRHGWLSRFGGSLAEDINSAERWGSEQSALTAALLRVVQYPNLIGKLEVVCIVVGPRRGDGWRIHLRQVRKEARRGTVLR